MAGDGRVVSGKYAEILLDNDVKVFKLSSYIIGIAGDATATDFILSTVASGHSVGIIKNAQAMRYSEKDGLEIYDKGPNWWTCRAKHYAIGIGEMPAMIAMDLGATAVEAVRVACKRSGFCGGKITQ